MFQAVMLNDVLSVMVRLSDASANTAVEQAKPSAAQQCAAPDATAASAPAGLVGCAGGAAGERPRWAAGKWRRLAERGKTNT